MAQVFPVVGAALAVAAAIVADKKSGAGYAEKDGLSLTVRMDKTVHGPADDVVLRFALRNESGGVRFVGDGFLAPAYHEAGPGRHFEVHVAAAGRDALTFWTGGSSHCTAAGVRKVFPLRPGEKYEGTIRLAAGVGAGEKSGPRPERRGGTFEDRASRERHALGVDARGYTARLRYQVDPKSRGVWEPPADFRDELLWKGELTTSPLRFEVSER